MTIVLFYFKLLLFNFSFIKLFRLSRETFKKLLDDTQDQFVVHSKSSAIPPILKLAVTLRFLAEGSYQRGVGQDYLIGMAQATVSVVITEVLNILETFMCPKYIKFELSEAEKKESKAHFYSKFGFPGIIGCIDGTHISIIRPNTNEHHYFNRKQYHSINAMIVNNNTVKASKF